jgi:O-methyltransferase
METTLSGVLRAAIPGPVKALRRRVVNYRREEPLRRFVTDPPPGLSARESYAVVKRLIAAHEHIDCAHTHAEMDTLVRTILSVPASAPGCIVEAGCFKGGSTAKLSIAAKLANRKLVVFDSFEGIPDNDEAHGRTMFNETTDFSKGKYAGQLEEVKDNVRRFGEIDVCEFVKGWFSDTMPGFKRDVAMAFIDVDLQSSTKTCVQYLYPLLIPGAAIFSHDGHLPLCVEALSDDRFWNETVGFPKPSMPDIGKVKLLRIPKPSGA